MKNILKYMSAFLLLLAIGTSCKDNDNWVIIEDVQPGNYLTGDATIYSAVASSSEFRVADLDGSDATDVLGIYTWLKSNGTFQVMKVDANGDQKLYGKGSVVASTPYETVELVEGGSPFSVAKDGLYNLILNNADNQLTVIEADFGIIGNATPGAWDSETKFTTVNYDEKFSTVEMTLSGVALNNKEIKFRYGQTWGISIPYGSDKVTIHSNMGGTSAGELNKSYTECKGGGDNFTLSLSGTYDVALRLELRNRKFSGKAICTGEDTSTAKLPEDMFVTGSPFDWNWEKAASLTPVHSHDGNFWGIFYFEKDAMIKFNSARAWNGDEFGAINEDALGYGEYPTGGSNLKIAESGFYQVRIVCSLSADKKTVEKKIILSEPMLYLVGSCSTGGYDHLYGDADKFTLDGNLYKNTLVGDGEIRMTAKLEGVDWWQSEFIIIDGKIEYRGAGNDQQRVQGKAGQVVSLDFTNNTGSIE